MDDIERKCAVCDRMMEEDEDYANFIVTPELEEAINKYLPELDMDYYLEQLVLCAACRDLPEDERRALSAIAVRKCNDSMSEEHKEKTSAIVATVMGQIH